MFFRSFNVDWLLGNMELWLIFFFNYDHVKGYSEKMLGDACNFKWSLQLQRKCVCRERESKSSNLKRKEKQICKQKLQSLGAESDVFHFTNLSTFLFEMFHDKNWETHFSFIVHIFFFTW